jgi:hypothetical protein
MSDDEMVPLPKHIRFARALALLASASLGFAAGATVVTQSGCGSCNGTPCGDFVYPPPDAASSTDGATSDMREADVPAADAGAGGGPLPAPPLPTSRLA